jgi:hypothetical protein
MAYKHDNVWKHYEHEIFEHSDRHVSSYIHESTLIGTFERSSISASLTGFIYTAYMPEASLHVLK